MVIFGGQNRPQEAPRGDRQTATKKTETEETKKQASRGKEKLQEQCF